MSDSENEEGGNIVEEMGTAGYLFEPEYSEHEILERRLQALNATVSSTETDDIGIDHANKCLVYMH